MIYWDASSVIPLVHQEAASSSVQAIYVEESVHATLTTTRVEVECALARLLHEGKVSSGGAARMRHEAKLLLDSFALVPPNGTVIETAVRLARAHPIDLRAGDALHLSAWQTISGSDPRAVEFVCLDGRLKKSALAEGATVLP